MINLFKIAYRELNSPVAFGQYTIAYEGYNGTSGQTGSLRVTIGPQTAVTAGAQWRVDGGAWHEDCRRRRPTTPKTTI